MCGWRVRDVPIAVTCAVVVEVGAVRRDAEPMVGASIFVSYRRADTNHVAGRLCDRLGYAFGKEHVFYDVDSIKVGTDFRAAIRSSFGVPTLCWC